MTIVVGGSSRKAGKTTVMCEIIAATREAAWTAIKLTPHEHEDSRTGDTERYLAAGAASALMAKTLPARLEATNLIIESNSVLATLAPDLFVFVQSEGEQKPSALEHAHRADVTICGHATPELIFRIEQALAATHS
jgi:molybdopterin-guanine dinucleotide biosynthesis protein